MAGEECIEWHCSNSTDINSVLNQISSNTTQNLHKDKRALFRDYPPHPLTNIKGRGRDRIMVEGNQTQVGAVVGGEGVLASVLCKA